MEGFGFSLAGLFVGFAVGATGVGGGSLMTPILILFYGVAPSLAVGTDLLYASISKTFGVALYRQKNSVDWRIVGWQALGSVPAALLTLLWLRHIGNTAHLDQLIKLTLSVAIIATATFTLFQGTINSWLRGAQAATGHKSELPQHLQRALTIAAGILIGSVVTISSVGAGAIGMTLLLLLYPNHAPARLVGSDLAHAVLITAIAGLGHAHMGTVNYSLLGWLLVGALPGIWLGARVGFRLDGLLLKRAVAALLLVVGSTTLTKALGPSAGHAVGEVARDVVASPAQAAGRVEAAK
ncbi:MAG: sulfite exporter TauE/SafE family protein [Nevskia sp.]|nr:sulfite exporter TauE/SafE family protein [Nevskia sp.]